ncbi:MAG TPA: GNAT family N-acetyltransferase [Pseudonocardiaceae bacterium]|jgi:ribosomal protein S18 acetylase RimI-like enzyme|nr:GNAT family N-acetyltransferase [Pseudonocardiaceae bacterium]
MTADVTTRPYAGPDDLRVMQGLTQRLWSHASNTHIGDQAWQRYQEAGREAGWPTMLWTRDGEIVAWGWIWLPGHLELLVDPAWPALAGEVLDWFAATATATTRTVTVTTGQTHTVAALERHGYQPDEHADALTYMSRSLADLPAPVLPAGFTTRSVRCQQDLDWRVAVHKAAWPTSRLTEESYRNVMAAWPYRADLDWIVESPDGEFVASCLIWLDEQNTVGELEPVGTDPRFRRMGLGRAVCLAALHALRRAGAAEAVVYPSDHGDPGATALYVAMDFQPYARTRTYTKL